MGGVIDSGSGIGFKSSLPRAEIEKTQAELRQEYDVREERRRELEFLETGGNPLDFKFGNGISHSVQSTLLAEKQAVHFVKSEVKDSFPRTASPHGDSVESSGRPGVSEPNTADNLLLFDAENKSLEGERNSKYPNKRNKTSESEQSLKANKFQNTKETEDSGIFRPYARRNRSKTTRDPARSSSVELVQSRGGIATSLAIRSESVDVKGSNSEAGNQKNRQASSLCFPSFATSKGNFILRDVVLGNFLKTEDDKLVVRKSTATTKNSSVKEKVDIAYKKSSADVASRENGLTVEKAHAVSASTVIYSLYAVTTGSLETSSTQLNGLRDPRREKESSINSAAGERGLDQESSHANNIEVDLDTKVDVHKVNKSDSNRIPMQSPSRVEGILNPTVGDMVNSKREDEAGDFTIITSKHFGHQSQRKFCKVENQDHKSTVAQHNENKCSETERKQQGDLDLLQIDMKVTSGLADTFESSLCPRKSQATAETSTCVVNEKVLLGSGITTINHRHSLDGCSNMADTLEDSILEKAMIIKAKRKRIAELSLGTIPVEIRTRSQWDYVLEEMAWLANDFMQERLWKMTAAMQICHRVAFTSQLKFDERVQQRKLKSIASTLANAVLQFWDSVEVPRVLEETSLGSDKETRKELKSDCGEKNLASGVTESAHRYLKFVKSSTSLLQAAAPLETSCDPGILETSWDQLTEERLFYSGQSGSMEAYRRSIESHLVCCTHYPSQKFRSSMQQEVETSAYDATEDTEYSGYNENEEETSTYYLPGALECSKSFNLTHKKRKNSMKYHSPRSYDLGADLPYSSYTDVSNPLMCKRPTSDLTVSVPMKRMRTASRQRIASPFGCDTVASLPVPLKTAASSGDTSSFQDEQSSLNGGSVVQKGTEAESSGNFEEQLLYDMAETSGKPKKKKSSAYEQAWHLDSMVHGEEDHRKKRPENNFNLNGMYGLHSLKKQKTRKKSMENNFDSAIPVTGYIPSPAASQMSDMSNPNKFVKFIGSRDRGRKIKGSKISSGHQGTENPWPQFEDQALVVLVHDMGPNWELISDAMNSTLKIKLIYRNPRECKERHNILMDRSGGDGADSAEDSENSQSYPSTLLGIPKGGARQLFQRLQEPVEEDTLKSHFEKICSIGKKYHYQKIQNDGQDPKQIVPVHNSQVMALSHVFPNNLNGSVLTPLDLCDASTSGQDVFSLEIPGSRPGLPMLNQGTAKLPLSEANPSITGSFGVVPGNNLSSTSGPTSASVRGSLPLDEQHRVQQYNQMLSSRNLQQPFLSTPGTVSGSDLGHLLPSGNAMSVNGTNRSTLFSRPDFQGVSSLTVSNTGNMLASGMGGISNTGNINSVGNSMMRPRGAMQHMMRMQAVKGNSQGIPALSSGFTNQTTPPVQAYPGQLSQQHQLSQQSHVLGGNSHSTHLQSPNHKAGTQQQAFSIRQRKMHQHYLQQQQQFPVSGAMTPPVPSRPQVHPVSSSPQNRPQTQPLASSQPLSMPLSSTSSDMTAFAQQHPQKPQFPSHGLGRNPQSGVKNQAGKQRQRQLQQQSGRQHPHQRQPNQGQQQNKLLKGMGRGNVMHQTMSADPLHLNGSTMSPVIQGTEKVEATVQAVPSQPFNPLTAVSTYPESKPLKPPQYSSTSQQHPKPFPGAPSPLSQQLQQRQLHSDNSIQGEKTAVGPGNILSTSSLSVTPAVTQPNHQDLLLHQKRDNQAQPTSHRTVHQNHDILANSQAEHSPCDPQSVTTTTQTASMGTTKGVPQASIDLVSMTSVGSTAVNYPPKELELPFCDSSEQNCVSKVSSSITNSTGSDQVTKMAQGLGHIPDGLLGHGQKSGTERQQQQLQKSPPLIQRQPQLLGQLLAQNRKRIPYEQQQPYLKTLELKVVHERSSSRPPDTKVE